MSRAIRVIDESQLQSFRDCELAPERLYQQIPDDDRVALVDLPPGVGKSRAAQRLLRYALEHDHDLVVYIAPTRAIIGELEIIRQLPPASVVVLEARPGQLCGNADPAWKDLERSGCAALAKATLCKPCCSATRMAENVRPDQLDRIGPYTRLVVLTEQYLFLNPLQVWQIRERVGSRRQLLILDEALFIGAVIFRRVSKTEIECFRDALTRAQNMTGVEIGTPAWLEGLDFLVDPEVELGGFVGSSLAGFASMCLRRNKLDVRALVTAFDIWHRNLSS